MSIHDDTPLHLLASSQEMFDDARAEAQSSLLFGLTHLLKRNFPMLQTDIEELEVSYRKKVSAAAEESFRLQLVGQGDVAMRLRRLLRDQKDVEDRLYHMLPEPLVDHRPAHEYVQDISRAFGDAIKSTAEARRWVSQLAPTTPIPFNAIRTQPQAMLTGIYATGEHAPGSQGDRFLVLNMHVAEEGEPRYRNRNVFALQEGELKPYLFTWVEIEKTWVMHTDFSYLDPEAFKKELKKVAPSMPGLMSVKQFMHSVHEVLSKHPIKRVSDEEADHAFDVMETEMIRDQGRYTRVVYSESGPTQTDSAEATHYTFTMQMRGLRLAMAWDTVKGVDNARVTIRHQLHGSSWDAISPVSRWQYLEMFTAEIIKWHQEDMRADSAPITLEVSIPEQTGQSNN